MFSSRCVSVIATRCGLSMVRSECRAGTFLAMLLAFSRIQLRPVRRSLSTASTEFDSVDDEDDESMDVLKDDMEASLYGCVSV